MTIYEKPETIYGFFVRNQYLLSDKMMVLCASGDMSIQMCSEDGDIVFVVFDGDDEIDSRVVFVDLPSSEHEAQTEYEDLILAYFGDPECEIDECDMDDEIRRNEKYLDDIMTEMIDAIVDGYTSGEIEEAAAGIKELVCDVLTKRYGFDVRRPMYLLDKSGQRVFEEYPYRKLNAGAQTVFK